jgi:hypothetical protein
MLLRFVRTAAYYCLDLSDYQVLTGLRYERKQTTLKPRRLFRRVPVDGATASRFVTDYIPQFIQASTNEYQDGKSAVFTTFEREQRRWSFDNPTTSKRAFGADRLPPLPSVPQDYDIAPVPLLEPHSGAPVGAPVGAPAGAPAGVPAAATTPTSLWLS